jgi:hypothetical protein
VVEISTTIMQRYRIDKDDSSYSLFEENNLLCSFTRETFRETLEKLDRSSKWIGYIVRLLNKQYPLEIKRPSVDSPERYSLGFLLDYMQSKGHRVFRPIHVSDYEIACHLMKKGYVVELSGGDENLQSEGLKEYESDILAG